MISAIKNLLLTVGGIVLTTSLILSVRADWLVVNISSDWFYALISTELILGGVAGVYWMWRKRDIDSIFFPSTALSLFLGIGFVQARAWTVNLFGSYDLLLALTLCIGMGGGALIALGLTIAKTKHAKKH